MRNVVRYVHRFLSHHWLKSFSDKIIHTLDQLRISPTMELKELKTCKLAGRITPEVLQTNNKQIIQLLAKYHCTAHSDNLQEQQIGVNLAAVVNNSHTPLARFDIDRDTPVSAVREAISESSLVLNLADGRVARFEPDTKTLFGYNMDLWNKQILQAEDPDYDPDKKEVMLQDASTLDCYQHCQLLPKLLNFMLRGKACELVVKSLSMTG